MDSDRERCLAAGMDGYLSKPIDPAMLFAVVEWADDGGVMPQLSVEASNVIDMLRRHSPSAREPTSCVS